MGALAPDRIMGIKKRSFGNKGGWAMTFWTKHFKFKRKFKELFLLL